MCDTRGMAAALTYAWIPAKPPSAMMSPCWRAQLRLPARNPGPPFRRLKAAGEIVGRQRKGRRRGWMIGWACRQLVIWGGLGLLLYAVVGHPELGMARGEGQAGAAGPAEPVSGPCDR